jgi:Ca2+-binding RTX toxin-like protein
MNGGNDTFSATGNLAALIGVTVDGGAGNDTISGSNGADILLGGDDDDFIDGQQGNDIVLLGAGNDLFQWDPGDGSDVVEGQTGIDTLAFNGSNIAETITISANGGRTLFQRDVAAIAMDLNDVERIEFRAIGGADRIVVDTLAGTDVTEVDIDLAGPVGGSDGQADRVEVKGTAGADTITVVDWPRQRGGDGPSGLGDDPQRRRRRRSPHGLRGRRQRRINASGARTGAMALTLSGEAGNDTLVSGAKADVLDGGLDTDTASYATSAAAVTVSLLTGLGAGGDAASDLLIGIENLVGSAAADTLTGSAGDNRLDGGGGGRHARGPRRQRHLWGRQRRRQGGGGRGPGQRHRS